MAKVLDVRNSGGILVVLGDNLVVPYSSDNTAQTTPGGLRYNDSTSSIEAYVPNSSNDLVWSPLVTAAQITADVNNYYLPNTGGSITGNLYVSGNLQVAGTLTAPVISGQASSALYAADIAERYHADDYYTPGTVLVVGGANEVTLNQFAEQTNVAGIVSTEPAYKMNVMVGSDETHPYIALKGKVPCKVIGPVNKGSHLCTSDVPGYAKMATSKTNNLACFAIALESCDVGKHVIEVKV
jgi:hypothetical protein